MVLDAPIRKESTGNPNNNVEPPKAAMVKWEREFNKKSKEEDMWEANNACICNLLLSHYSPEFRSKLQDKKGCAVTEDE